jgi:hypothetical protein
MTDLKIRHYSALAIIIVATRVQRQWFKGAENGQDLGRVSRSQKSWDGASGLEGGGWRFL